MPALQDQPYPSFRVSRIAWLKGDIRRQHSQLLAMIPALPDSDSERLSATWEAVIHRAIELRCACAELEGLRT